MEWIRRSAECGNASAQCTIGINYWVGEIVEKDLQQAQKWFEKAISSGDYNAMSCLGLMYENEDIKDSDGKQKAFQLYKQAAMRGNVTSYYCVANCYYWGSGTEKNDIEALRWYNKIAEIYENMKEKGEDHFTEESGAGIVSFCDFKNSQESFASAFENLAWIYRNSETVEHNANLAIKWEIISKMLKGEDIDVKQLEDIKQLEDVARKNNNVEAVDKEVSKPHHVIKVGNKYGYSDRNNNVVIPCQWTKANNFVDGVALVWEEKKMGAIDEKGNYYFPCKIACDEASLLGHGLIKSRNGILYSIHDLNGKNIEYELFAEVGDEFVDGYLYAVKYRMFGKNKPGRIDTKGKFV